MRILSGLNRGYEASGAEVSKTKTPTETQDQETNIMTPNFLRKSSLRRLAKAGILISLMGPSSAAAQEADPAFNPAPSYDDIATWPTVAPIDKALWPAWGYYARSPWSGETTSDLVTPQEKLDGAKLGTKHAASVFSRFDDLGNRHDTYEYRLQNRNIDQCLRANTTKGAPNRPNTLGIVYSQKADVVRSKGRKYARLRVGLADWQIAGSPRIDGKNYTFDMSCEGVATDTKVRVSLLKKIGKKATKVVYRAPNPIQLKNPGYKGTDYLDRLYGSQAIDVSGSRKKSIDKGLKPSQLEWSTFRFPIKGKASQYAVSIKVESRPKTSISCDTLKATQPGAYNTFVSCERDYSPKTVRARKASSTITSR